MLCPRIRSDTKRYKTISERVIIDNVKVILTHTPPFTRDSLSEEIVNIEYNHDRTEYLQKQLLDHHKTIMYQYYYHQSDSISVALTNLSIK